MATPTGLDRDFNYLRGVERSIDHASQDAEDRGIGGKSTGSRNVLRGWRNDSALQRYLAQHDITVEHAPKGMSRQKSNQTRPTKSNRIVWTVEWLLESGERSLQHDCAEDCTVATLYESHLAEARVAERKPRGSKRRKVEASGAEQTHHSLTTALPGKTSSGDAGNPADDIVSPSTQATETIAKVESSSTGDAEPPQTNTAIKPELSDTEHPTKTAAEDQTSSSDPPQAESSPKIPDPKPTTQKEDSQDTQNLNFYLLKPATTSPAKVLIPLNRTATLTTCLQNQTIQEYPTLVILTSPPATLPAGYILLEEYVKARREEERELKTLLSAAPGVGKAIKSETALRGERSKQEEEGEEDEKEEELDAQSILNMLKRDVR